MKTATIVEESTTDLAQVLDAVENGETITIARHGFPVAVMVPVPPEQRAEAIDDLMRRWDEARKGVTLGGLSIREMIDEGRA